jgi:predicted CoA-binding protein
MWHSPNPPAIQPLYQIEYSDQLLIQLLKAWLPNKYRERIEVRDVKDLKPEDLSPEVLQKITEQLIANAQAQTGVSEAEIVRLALEAGITVVEAKSELVETRST